MGRVRATVWRCNLRRLRPGRADVCRPRKDPCYYSNCCSNGEGVVMCHGVFNVYSGSVVPMPLIP